ncbi:MAG: TIGR01212 family radical SAM protein [Lachnospiraceae bacterium]|nr:TIGR01212 family radical SAM protein [Lachnospiraceae bacterium]
MTEQNWHGKPYYSLDAYLKNTFGHKCYKIALNAHMTCPNRDGTLGTRGCIFCSRGGSGDFAVSTGEQNIQKQLQEGRTLFGDKQVGNHFIAYFQAYTNTYGPIEYLEQIYCQALDAPEIIGISIATRPDCLGPQICALLSRLQARYPDKFIWVELGLQTIHEATAIYIRRGYVLSCFEQAMKDLRAIGIPVIINTILGLPGETQNMMLQTVRYLNQWHPFGVKLQLLHVLKDTDLADQFLRGKIQVLTKDAYLDILIKCLEQLSPQIVIHRVTGDGPKELLLAPTFSLNKRDVLNSLHRRMRTGSTYQGRLYTVSPGTKDLER